MVKIQIFNVIKSLRRYTIIDVLIIFFYHNNLSRRLLESNKFYAQFVPFKNPLI